MPTTPSKSDQEAEAHARAQSKSAVPAGETVQALEVIGDTDVAPAPAPIAQPQREAKEPPRLPEARSKFDSKRDEITARFRSHRTTDVDTDQDDVAEFARSNGMPEEFRQFEQPQVPVEGQVETTTDEALESGGEPEPQPQRVKLKVHGKDVEMTLEEALAKAQIALASDNLLDESKVKLKEVEQLLAETRNRAAYPAQNPQHQPVQSQVQQPEQIPQQQPAQHQGDTKKLVELIQFGDPDEAEAAIQNTIEARSQQIVQQQLLNARLADEGARAAKVLKDFEDQNPDLAKDPKARAAIEVSIYEIQLQDLAQLGIDPARLRPDGLPATPADIANAHRFYRAQGFNVKSPKDMLEKARDEVLAWKGVPKQPEPEQPATPPKQPVKLAPKVELTLDRQARRQAIPQQPSRTTTAPAPPAANPLQPRDRSTVVQDMKARNAKLRGQTLGI